MLAILTQETGMTKAEQDMIFRWAAEMSVGSVLQAVRRNFEKRSDRPYRVSTQADLAVRWSYRIPWA